MRTKAIPGVFGVFRDFFFFFFDSVTTGEIFLYSCTKNRLGNCDRRNCGQIRAFTCHYAVQCTQFHAVPAKKCSTWPTRGPRDVPTCSSDISCPTNTQEYLKQKHFKDKRQNKKKAPKTTCHANPNPGHPSAKKSSA